MIEFGNGFVEIVELMGSGFEVRSSGTMGPAVATPVDIARRRTFHLADVKGVYEYIKQGKVYDDRCLINNEILAAVPYEEMRDAWLKYRKRPLFAEAESE